MRGNAGWNGAAAADPALRVNPYVKQPLLPLPCKREGHREPLFAQPALGPGHFADRNAFDEIGVRMLGQVMDEIVERLDRKAGTRNQVNVTDFGRDLEQHLCRASACLDQRPGAPVAIDAWREMHVFEIAHLVHQIEKRSARRPAVDVDNHGAAVVRQVAGNLSGPVERRMGHHDETDSHAQLPFDISPSISSWRQPIRRSDQSHQSPFRP